MENSASYFFHDFDGYRFYCLQEDPHESSEHSHQAIQITLPLSESSARVCCQTATGGLSCYQLNTGQMCIFAPYQLHTLEWSQATNLILFFLEPQFIQKVVGNTATLNTIAISGETILNDLTIRQICTQFKTEVIHHSKHLDFFYLDTLANLLVIHLIKTYTRPLFPPLEPKEGLTQTKLKHVVDYIEAHLSDGISLEILAEQLNLSRYHFSRLFKKSMGLSPYQYVIQERIKLAKKLLAEQDLSIIEIAYCCGFSSQSHLTKYFKQQTGKTPKQYRDLG